MAPLISQKENCSAINYYLEGDRIDPSEHRNPCLARPAPMLHLTKLFE